MDKKEGLREVLTKYMSLEIEKEFQNDNRPLTPQLQKTIADLTSYRVDETIKKHNQEIISDETKELILNDVKQELLENTDKLKKLDLIINVSIISLTLILTTISFVVKNEIVLELTILAIIMQVFILISSYFNKRKS